MGQSCIRTDSAAVIEAPVGKVFIFGPEITFRGQPHRTRKSLFNGIYAGRAQAVSLAQAERAGK